MHRVLGVQRVLRARSLSHAACAHHLSLAVCQGARQRRLPAHSTRQALGRLAEPFCCCRYSCRHRWSVAAVAVAAYHCHHSMRQTVNALVKLACVVSLLAYSPDMFVESIGSWRILDTVRTVVPRALLLLLLIALNGLIYWRLSDRVSQTRRISGREHVRHGAIRFNRMVLAQSMLFVMGNLPWLCVSLARSIQQHNASSDPIADPLLDSVVELPLLVSLGISSFVYFVLDKRFRSETVHLIAGMRATASVAPL